MLRTGSYLCCLGTRIFLRPVSLSHAAMLARVLWSHKFAHLLVVVHFRQSASGPALTLVHAVGSFWYLAPQFTPAMISPNCSAFHSRLRDRAAYIAATRKFLVHYLGSHSVRLEHSRQPAAVSQLQMLRPHSASRHSLRYRFDL